MEGFPTTGLQTMLLFKLRCFEFMLKALTYGKRAILTLNNVFFSYFKFKNDLPSFRWWVWRRRCRTLADVVLFCFDFDFDNWRKEENDLNSKLFRLSFTNSKFYLLLLLLIMPPPPIFSKQLELTHSLTPISWTRSKTSTKLWPKHSFMLDCVF